MNPDLLKLYLGKTDELETAVKGLSPELLSFIPFEGAWSIRQHVVHVAETDINQFIRFRSIVGSPGTQVYVIDEEAWARNIDYETENMEHYLKVFRLLRTITADFVSRTAQETLDKGFYLYRREGESREIGAEKALELYVQHVDDHLEMIRRNIRLWNKK